MLDRCSRRKTSQGATLCNTNPTWTDPCFWNNWQQVCLYHWSWYLHTDQRKAAFFLPLSTCLKFTPNSRRQYWNWWAWHYVRINLKPTLSCVLQHTVIKLLTAFPPSSTLIAVIYVSFSPNSPTTEVQVPFSPICQVSTHRRTYLVGLIKGGGGRISRLATDNRCHWHSGCSWLL